MVKIRIKKQKIQSKFPSIAKVYTQEILEGAHSRKFILAKVNFGPWRSRKLIPAKVYTNKVDF